MRDKYKSRQAVQAVESQERAKWTTTEDEFIIKAQQRFATIYNKWVKIAELLEGRSNIDVANRWSGSLWDYERTHPHLQGHTTVLVKHFVSEDHDGMNLRENAHTTKTVHQYTPTSLITNKWSTLDDMKTSGSYN